MHSTGFPRNTFGSPQDAPRILHCSLISLWSPALGDTPTPPMSFQEDGLLGRGRSLDGIVSAGALGWQGLPV